MEAGSSTRKCCPKCGSVTLFPNEDGDLECVCGGIIYKTRHYSEVKKLKPTVIDAIEKGLGVRQTARELDLAVNTVRTIVREDNKASQAQKARRAREKEHHWLRFALKGLATHSATFTTGEMFERAMKLLEKYMKGNPQRTVKELIPEAKDGTPFRVDQLIDKTIEILIEESLNYCSDVFEKIGEGEYKLIRKQAAR